MNTTRKDVYLKNFHTILAVQSTVLCTVTSCSKEPLGEKIWGSLDFLMLYVLWGAYPECEIRKENVVVHHWKKCKKR